MRVPPNLQITTQKHKYYLLYNYNASTGTRKGHGTFCKGINKQKGGEVSTT